MNTFLQRLIPFIFLGILLVLFVVGVILFSYLLIVGAIVGLILFLIAWVKEKFFPGHKALKPKHPRSHRTIDHRD
ncbi:MAG: hypothetical protein ACD_60C00117G0001 [uncultured bacterium]|nr:MAG: hypothetical protein ACD_60C00117G0001 [uncultured bacterium]